MKILLGLLVVSSVFGKSQELPSQFEDFINKNEGKVLEGRYIGYGNEGDCTVKIKISYHTISYKVKSIGLDYNWSFKNRFNKQDHILGIIKNGTYETEKDKKVWTHPLGWLGMFDYTEIRSVSIRELEGIDHLMVRIYEEPKGGFIGLSSRNCAIPLEY